MTADEAIAFLRAHQPMPSDRDITPAEADTFISTLKHFEEHPDARCVPLLINCVSETTGLGIYEYIQFVLMKHAKDDVIPHLRDGLISGSPGVKARCCWWACDVGAWQLEPLIRPLARSDDKDVQISAEAFLTLRDEAQTSDDRT